MSKFPHFNNPQEDENLLVFLRKYQPIAPAARKNCEQKLMGLIEKEKSNQSKLHLLPWLIPSVIAASIFLIFGANFGLKPIYQTGEHDPELETFLVNSWQGVIDENNPLDRNSPEYEWLVFTKIEN